MADSESTQSKSTRRSAAAKSDDVQAETQSTGNGNDSPPPIPVSQLVTDGSELLGYPSHVVAGALYGRDPDEELEIDDAKSQIETWLQKPVEVDPGEADEGEVE